MTAPPDTNAEVHYELAQFARMGGIAVAEEAHRFAAQCDDGTSVSCEHMLPRERFRDASFVYVITMTSPNKVVSEIMVTGAITDEKDRWKYELIVGAPVSSNGEIPKLINGMTGTCTEFFIAAGEGSQAIQEKGDVVFEHLSANIFSEMERVRSYYPARRRKWFGKKS